MEIETCVSSWDEVVEVLSSFSLGGPSPHLRTHCHCLNSLMMMNLQTLASSPVVQIALTWRKAQVNFHQLSLEVICEPFCDWNLWDHFSILLPPTSLEFQWL